MFDIGFLELLVVAAVALLVVGPERLPDAVRTTSRWWSGLKRTLHSAREELEREVGADDIRRELHNERIMREIEESRREMEQTFSEANKEVHDALNQPEKPQVAGTPVEKQAAGVNHPEAPKPEKAIEEPAHPRAEQEDYLPEQDETAEELQDPEYPEHWHDFGDPDLNPDHPENIDEDEEEKQGEKKTSQQEKDSQS
ncbi:Sec-independent protein translocase protein TatB [Microbulbifer sp. ANSA003]|uniref:Sec-independent protein translocase protein TatB n=1 Tax=unclassified Microbulbifer TaxID=2619833 RepID=UPI0024AE8797|nr:Sec-independent protein translocase protein TatB [Microbulbifer sp. VAAF005]WHI44973.1 Sec-independent protein translocase protein TatB [Microbulbifer sp. VAAF005]WNZ56258.1 Sec-independent protein translocase protein TatB [Microbulbifer sp. MKSA007]